MPPNRPQKPNSIDPNAAELARLTGEEQVEYALGLLQPRTRRDTLQAALKVLRPDPPALARPDLIALHEHFSRNGGAFDYGGYARIDILHTLKPLLRPEDVDLLVLGARTCEFPPPHFVEETGRLRATALVLLADLDDHLARFHAARLLVDPYCDAMSGEPGVTAAQVLAACGELLPLFECAMDARPGRPSEVAAECLRALTTLPVPLVDDLVNRPGVTESPVLHIALIDLLLRHEKGPLRTEWLLESLRKSPLEVYRYALFAIVAAGNDDLLSATVSMVRREQEPNRKAAGADALDLVRTRADVAALLESPAFKPAGRKSRE